MKSPDECDRYGSAGRLSCNIEAKIVDPETGEALSPMQQGELWLRGPMIMKGDASSAFQFLKVIGACDPFLVLDFLKHYKWFRCGMSHNPCYNAKLYTEYYISLRISYFRKIKEI